MYYYEKEKSRFTDCGCPAPDCRHHSLRSLFRPELEDFLNTTTGRYYAYSLLLAFIGVILTVAGLYRLFGRKEELSRRESCSV